ncbi:MAG: hypothetical protein FJ137_15830 [Deltaproteobacteria bacterium]|nr:hypothetical protein [Deltaproteobacteria bacterium]
MQFVSMVAGMSEDTFAEVIGSSPRKIRETLFARLNIKAKKQIGLRVHGKLEHRTKKLHERLKTAQSANEDKLCEELVRNWLFTKRPLLKATLDHLGVKNDNGLVDEDPVFFKELTAEKVADLVNVLKAAHPVEHIRLYLAFVGVPDAALDDGFRAAA